MAAGRTVHTQKNRVNRQGQYVYVARNLKEK